MATKLMLNAIPLFIFASLGWGAATTVTTRATEPVVYGAQAAKNDADLTLADMLTYAIEDEWQAHAEYTAVIKNLGAGRPFTNIVKAEVTHEKLLTPLLEKYDVPLPSKPDVEATIASAIPASIPDAFQHGVDAEISNIAMYERFLTQTRVALPSDVKTAFEMLCNASKNHLAAFERGTARFS